VFDADGIDAELSDSLIFIGAIWRGEQGVYRRDRVDFTSGGKHNTRTEQTFFILKGGVT
jgi:hypothetical protein